MQVIDHRGSWMIARNFRLITRLGVRGTHGRSSDTARLVYDVWTGKEWYGRKALAKLFGSKEDAERYLDDNREHLESAR